MLHNWHILLTLALGVILGTAILASGPLLVDTVINFSLPYRLRSLDPLSTNLRLTGYSKPDLAGYQAIDGQISTILERRLGVHLAQVDGLTSTTWLYPWQGGQPATDQRLAISAYEALTGREQFIAGGWPSGAPLQGNVLQVVVSEAFADHYGLLVGDQLPVSSHQGAQDITLWLSIGGIIRPADPSAGYWLGKYSRLLNQASGKWQAEFYVFINPEQFFSITSQLFPGANTRMDWNAIINPDSFQASETSAVRSQVDLLRADLKEMPNAVFLETKLDQVMIEFTARARVIRLTLYVLIGEVLLLTLYYIAMVASLAIQHIEAEFSTLSSRGASFIQLLKIQSAEALNIGLLSIILGPLLAVAMVYGLARFGPLADIAPAGKGLSLPAAGWIAAGLSVAACLTGMILPVGSAVRRSIVTYSRSVSRTERVQWWQRTYLDVFVLVIGLLLLWRWRFYGNLVPSGAGASGVDWLLILSPLILLVSSATILLRIFPPVLRFFSRLAARGRGISTTLALWQTSRYPSHVARLVLLLTLSMALGILTAGINATLNVSEYERALYAAGADLRMSFNGLIPIKSITGSPGIQATSVVWRGTGSSTIRYHDVIPSIDILAIDPFSFSTVTRYRDDYSVEPMGELLGMVASHADMSSNPVIPLPGKPGRLGMWAYDELWHYTEMPQLYNRLDELVAYAKLQSADGQFFVVKLVRLVGSENSEEKPGWNYLEAPLPDLAPDSYPLAFHSFWFTTRPAGFMGMLNLILDDFSTIDAVSGEDLIFEDFEGVERIWQTSNRNTRAFFSNSLEAHSGSASLAYSLPFQFNPFGYGLMPASTTRSEPLPALISTELLKITQVGIGDEIQLNILSTPTSIRIAGLISYFPTLYDRPGHGFIVLPRDALMVRLNRQTRNAIFPNEIWLDTAGGQASAQLQDDIHTAAQSWNFETERLVLKADALLLGLRSVTFLATILTTILSLVGFATHFYLTARQREMQFSILRALGLSPGQLYAWLLLEQVIMVFTGLTLGTLFGILLNRMILPGLPITFGDRPAIPPFFPLEDWMAVVRLYLTFLSALLVSLGIATGLLWRANIHRALRIGQE